jgi:hypothetical protein
MRPLLPRGELSRTTSRTYLVLEESGEPFYVCGEAEEGETQHVPAEGDGHGSKNIYPAQ